MTVRRTLADLWSRPTARSPQVVVQLFPAASPLPYVRATHTGSTNAWAARSGEAHSRRQHDDQ